MKKANLPAKWVQWQRYRYQGCIAQGLAAPLAYKLAATEAKWRHRVSKVIGFDAARDIERVELIETDKGFGLRGSTAGLTDDQISRLGDLVFAVESAAA